MATISEILLVINETLQGYESEVKKAGAKITTLQVNGKERVEIREEIKEKLNKEQIKYEQKIVPGSSFEGLEIVESFSSILRIIFKTKGGGSGLGSEGTTIVESAQAVYAAIAFGLGRHITNADITMNMLLIQKISLLMKKLIFLLLKVELRNNSRVIITDK